MSKEEVLNKILGRDYTELVPSTILNSDQHILNSDEFDILRKHLRISEYKISENNYNTIIIGNLIFKKIDK